MDRRELLFGMAALGVGRSVVNHLLNLRSIEVATQSSVTGNAQMTDRERAGLRGPVWTVSEDSTKTEYDPFGRLISNRWLANPGSESADSVTVETRSYDGSGRLLTDTKRVGNTAPIQKVYSYDDRGRLLRIVDGSGDYSSLQYDAQGRKTETRDIAHSDDREGAFAIGMDLMFADVDGDPDLIFGGIRNPSRIRTIYNEHDQPTETQALDADGHLLGRILRAYDEKGRITDIRTIIDDPTSQFSEKQKADMIAQAGVSLDEMKAYMKKAFDVMMGDMGKSYAYDSQGRRAKVILHQGSMGDFTRTYSYNDHGDVVEEKTTLTKHPSMPTGVTFSLDESGNLVPDKPPSEWPSQPDFSQQPAVRYTYQYDSYGNWTEQTMNRSDSPPYTRRRELTYY